MITELLDLAQSIINGKTDPVDGAVTIRNIICFNMDILENSDFDIFVLIDSEVDDLLIGENRDQKKIELGNYHKENIIKGCKNLINFVKKNSEEIQQWSSPK